MKCVQFTERMVEFAGLSGKVKVFHGSVSTSDELFGSCGSGIKQILLENHGCSAFNILFIDHDKMKYIEDLNIIESCGLLTSGKNYSRQFINNNIRQKTVFLSDCYFLQKCFCIIIFITVLIEDVNYICTLYLFKSNSD